MKKNLIAAAILVTVCAGIYVNWRYTEDQAAANLTDTLDTEKVMSDDNLVLSEDMAAISAGEDVATTSTDYFAAVRLSRQQARDNAVNLLQEAMSYSESSKEAESAVELEQIVQTALSEAQIESLIIAKGYADCVAYMSGEGISIAVASPEGGLQREDVAVIADIVMAQSEYSLNDIRVVEVQEVYAPDEDHPWQSCKSVLCLQKMVVFFWICGTINKSMSSPRAGQTFRR